MQHVIIGAGPAGVIAAETIKRTDSSSKVLLLGNEPESPYSRMALPYLLADEIEEEGTFLRHGAGHYDTHGIEVRNAHVSAVTPDRHTVTLDGGDEVKYDRLLVASGSHPVSPPIDGIGLPGVESCWTLADARRIVDQAKPGSRVALMGAGFIGCIILEALVARKVELTVIELADRMLARMMDEPGGEMIKRWCENKGVKVLTGTRVTGMSANSGGGIELNLDGATGMVADLVVSATGVAPNVDFLAGTGVEVEAGVLVDHHLQTKVEHIYAAGDVAQGPAFPTGALEVHAIQPTASEHGRIAGRNMVGATTRYGGSLSMNVLNTLGLVSSSFGVWQGVAGGEQAIISDPQRFKYLRLEFQEDRVVGALALGLTQHVGVIRGLVQTQCRLGAWKDRLMRDPHRIMEAYLECTQGDPNNALHAA